MKKILITAALIVGTAKFSNAQSNKTPDVQAQQLKQQLNLSDDQTKKVTAVLKQLSDSSATDSLKILQASGDKKALVAYALRMLDKRNAVIEPILTDDQKKKLEEQMASAKAMLQMVAGGQ